MDPISNSDLPIVDVKAQTKIFRNISPPDSTSEGSC